MKQPTLLVCAVFNVDAATAGEIVRKLPLSLGFDVIWEDRLFWVISTIPDVAVPDPEFEWVPKVLQSSGTLFVGTLLYGMTAFDIPRMEIEELKMVAMLRSHGVMPETYKISFGLVMY